MNFLVDENAVPLSNGEFLHERLQLNGIINSFTIYDGSRRDWAKQDHSDLQRQLNEFIDLHLAWQWNRGKEQESIKKSQK